MSDRQSHTAIEEPEIASVPRSNWLLSAYCQPWTKVAMVLS